MKKIKKIILFVLMIFIISGCVEKQNNAKDFENKSDHLNGTWVQDANITDVTSIIMEMTERNSEYIQNTGSMYITGPAKSEGTDKVGIYFVDPTSSK